MEYVSHDAGYVIYEDSDEDDYGESSDDNEDDLLAVVSHSMLKKRERRKDADDFEKEMNLELNDTMTRLRASNDLTALPSTSGSTAKRKSDDKTAEFYDDIYFDSDEEEEQNGKRKKAKHPIISNDDLFYDPSLDQQDQDWVDKRRRKYCPWLRTGENSSTKPSSANRGRPGKSSMPSSDAVLNCPACMYTLCRDCQRHEVYKGQYRAMFVFNCRVDFGQTLTYPVTSNGKKQKFKKPHLENLQDNVASGNSNQDIYHPVFCQTCNTEVAVYDKDEVYHFYNVLTGFG